MALYLEAACLCNTGKIRKNNEDNFSFDGRCLQAENAGLVRPILMRKPLQRVTCVAVFDGMGGENFGEIASYVAADCMNREAPGEFCLFDPVKSILTDLCLRINDAVVRKARELCTDRMGSTLAALFFFRKQIYISNLGDSRIYRIRNGSIEQLSVDHVEKSNGQAKKKMPLTQHLGISPEEFLLEPYVAADWLRRDDQYLLCSDGLTDMVSDDEICDIVIHSEKTEDCVHNLIDAALRSGGKDNVTAIMCRIL